MTWNPAQYEKFKDKRSQPFFDLMNMIAPIPTGEAIDLGCGTGELTKILHEYLQAKKTTGTDSSREMLEKAQTFASSNLSFIQSDIDTWKPTQKYDVIFSNAALQWCHHHKELFAKFFQALNPGGQLAIQMPMNHDFPTHVLAEKMSREESWNKLLGGVAFEKYHELLPVETYAQLVFNLGFTQQNVSLRVYDHVMDSREEVVEWVKGSMLTYFRSRLNEKDYERFVIEFRERLFQELADDRPFFYPFKRMILWARK